MKCGKALSEKIKSDRFIDIKRPLKFHKVINLSQNIAQLSITAKTVRKLLTCVPTYTPSKKVHISAILPIPASPCLLHSTGLMILATSTSLIEASRIQLFIQKKFTILERLCQSITAVFWKNTDKYRNLYFYRKNNQNVNHLSIVNDSIIIHKNVCNAIKKELEQKISCVQFHLDHLSCRFLWLTS